MSARTLARSLAALALLVAGAAVASAAPGSAPAETPAPPPADAGEEAPLLPPVGADRTVVIDSSAALQARARQLKLSDLDPEQADIVREINRKPGTWQLYLLYTAEDLPEILFHPGFAIRLGSRKATPAAPEPPEPSPPPADAPPRPKT